jgi:hypothetical protein
MKGNRMTTPHHIGQITKAEILVAHLLETAPPDADTQRQAKVIVNQLQTELGWTPPRDLTEAPPLRPERIADPEVQRAVLNRPKP